MLQYFPGKISMVFVWEFEIEFIEKVVWNNDCKELIVQFSWKLDSKIVFIEIWSICVSWSELETKSSSKSHHFLH